MWPALLSFTLVGLLLLVPAASSHAIFSLEQVACRHSLGRLAARLVHSAALHTAKCHLRRDRSGGNASIDCNSLAEYGADTRVGKAEARLRTTLGGGQGRCAGLKAWAMDYQACPEPCTAAIASLDDVAACIVCLSRYEVSAMSEAALGNPANVPINDQGARSCRSPIGKKQAKHLAVILKERVKCQGQEEREGGTDTAWCSVANPKNRIGRVRTKVAKTVRRRCAGITVGLISAATIESCSDSDDIADLEGCLFDDSADRGARLFESFYSLENASVTTTTMAGVTTTTLPVPAATWAEVREVFVRKCTACHGQFVGLGGLSELGDATAGYAELVGVSSECGAGATALRVVAGEPGQSFLYEKITSAGPSCGDPMPPGGSVDSADVETIRSWIAGGALPD